MLNCCQRLGKRSAVRAALRLFAVYASGTVSACVGTYVRPQGDWANPVELQINAQTLANVKLKVECIRQEEDEPSLLADNELCRQLRVALRQLGAILPADDAEPEALTNFVESFTLQYVGFPDGGSSACGLSSWLSVYTFTTICEDEAVAELRIVDRDRVVRRTRQLRVKGAAISGPGALIWFATGKWDPERSPDGTRRRAFDKIVRYARNTVVSYVRRDEA